MADQKRWFKVWTSLLVDMDFRPAAEVGHWTRLGCRIALTGTSGTVMFEGGWAHVAAFLHVPETDVQRVVTTLPGVHVEESENRDGGVTVTMVKWQYYQEDSTGAERMKTLRSKRRGEEKRGEERRKDEKTPPIVPPTGKPDTTLQSAKEVLGWLNAKAGRTFRASETNLTLIRARLRDGIEPWQLRAIVSRKVREWGPDPKMVKYLRPATLFNREKCEQYLGELPATVPEEDPHGSA